MVVVTGGTGLLGSHLLVQLAQKGEKVKALKREKTGTAITRKVFSYYSEESEKLWEKIEWVEGDILDIYSLLKVIEKGDKVYHTAAIVSFDPAKTKEIFETNITGTANVVNACLEKKAEKLAYVSSIAALGRTNQADITNEETEWKPGNKISDYSISKYEAEREVWRGIAEGLKAVIINPSVILGPGDFSKGSIKMFPTVYNGLKFYTRGMNGYVDVNDVARALILLMNSKISNERFIVNAENISYKDLFDMMSQALQVPAPQRKAGRFLSELSWRLFKIHSMLTGKEPLITRQTAQTANNTYRYSNQKITDALGMTFTPIRETIKKTAEIFLKELE